MFRARGLSPAQAEQRAAALLGEHEDQTPGAEVEAGEDVVGSAGGSSFVAFASGAVIPILPLVVTSGRTAIVIAAVLVGVALLPPGRPSGC